jgi:hypothetical protein
MAKCDFSGWATYNDLECADGKTIRRNAFKDQDGSVVPLVWMHDHDNPEAVLGHALLENREEGVYAHCTFNDTQNGQLAKKLVAHGDVRSLSIWANKLKQVGRDVVHGKIRELSLVLAGANPGATIESVSIAHGDGVVEDELIINYDECGLVLYHSDMEESEENNEIEHADKKEDESVSEKKEKTIKDVINTMTEEQKTAMYAVVGAALEEAGAGSDDDNDDVKHFVGGEEEMKYNVFEQESTQKKNYISHADQEAILSMAKQSNVGSLRMAMEIYAEENGLMHNDEDGDTLSHGVFEDYGVLFPEFKLLKEGEPDTLEKYDQSWVGPALRKIHKSPYSRIRTRYADARIAELKAKGYQNKGDQKTLMNQITVIGRTTDPQTIYIKDEMHRDDIIDVTDFDTVAYQWRMMRRVLDETMILAAMIGDGREVDDPDKIHETHVRPIWTDDELYTIHRDVDIEAARTELQGTDTNANFGENYIYAEAIITAALYAREKYKGSGALDFYCTPHLVNVMLLARDLNGRRIYDSKADLAKALNVSSIVEVEQFENQIRTTDGGDKKKLLGLFVNLNDYQFGSTKGGEITRFEDFDMDFNKKKFMLETRLSGSLRKIQSAIALELPVDDTQG